MNIYEKLQECRSQLQSMEIKESGNNKFAGYTYMELGDFLPHIVELCKEHKLCTVVCFGDLATLTVVNSENPEEKVLFTSPMSTAELKGCHAIQNLGAVETYLRRYLYVAAFDIVEHDALDSTQGKAEPQQRQQPAKSASQGQNAAELISEAQQKMIFAKMKSKGLAPETLKEAFKVESSKVLKKAQMNDILAWIDGQAQQ
jgi:hypothetical protein